VPYYAPSSSPVLSLNTNFSGHMKQDLPSIEQLMDVSLNSKRQELSCRRDHEDNHILRKCAWNTLHKHVHTSSAVFSINKLEQVGS
jgi:hypothetical protein